MPRDTLVSTIKRSELSKAGRDSVVKFKEEFDEYARLIDPFNGDRTAVRHVRKCVRKCIKVDLLANLIMMDIIKNVDEIANLTIEQVM